MADETPNPVPALNDQPAPPGFTKYALPDGRNVFLDKRLSAEQINAAIGGLLDRAEAAKSAPAIPKAAPGGEASVLDRLGTAPGTPFQPTSLREPPTGTKAEDVMSALVPKTRAEQLGLLATGGAGLFTKALPWGQRAAVGILSAATGGEIGNTAEGGTPGKGLLQGVGAAAGEMIGKGAELARRGIANLTGGLYAKDATKIGQAVGDLVPALKGADSPEKLRDLVMSGEGKDRLFERIMAGYDEVKQLIGNRPLYLPSIQQAMTFDEAKKLLTSKFRTGFKAGQETVTPGTLPSDASRQARSDFFTILQDVRNDLQRLDPTATRIRVGATNVPGTPGLARPGATEPPVRGGYDIGAGGQAVAAFDEARRDFRVGVNLLDLLYRANGQSNRLFQGAAAGAGEKGVEFQTNRLQNFMSANEAKLRKRLGNAEFDAIAKEVYRGAEPGTMDTQGVSLGRIFGRQSLPLSGGAILERFPIASIPNYTGKPFTPTAGQQTLLDALMQHGLTLPVE